MTGFTPKARSSFRAGIAFLGLALACVSGFLNRAPIAVLLVAGICAGAAVMASAHRLTLALMVSRERKKESKLREGRPVIGAPPQRDCFQRALEAARAKGKSSIDRYLVGFELDTGAPLWLTDDEMCTHGCVFAKTGVGKTLWLE